jgi:hypothetical protein
MGKLFSKYIFRVKCAECKNRMKRRMSFYDKRTKKYYCATCVPNELFKTSIYGCENKFYSMSDHEIPAVGICNEISI